MASGASPSRGETADAVKIDTPGCGVRQSVALASDPDSDQVVATFVSDEGHRSVGTEINSISIGSSGQAPLPGSVNLVSSVVVPGGPSEHAVDPKLAFNPFSVGADVADSYVVVYSTGVAGSTQSQIVAQQLSALGEPIAGTSTLVSGDGETLSLPDITYDGARHDEYVAVWVDEVAQKILGRRLGRSGVVGGETFVVHPDADPTDPPAVAVDPFTGFIFVANKSGTSIVLNVLEGTEPDPFARLFVSTGSGTQNSDVTSPDVATNTDRPGALVVWSGQGGAEGLDGAESEIWARLIGADGAVIGEPIRVSEMGTDGSTASGGFSPAVAYDAAKDRYVVVWQGSDESVAEGASNIWTRSVSADGLLVGDQRRVTDVPTARSALEPAVAVSGAGKRVLSWHTSEGCDEGGPSQVMAMLIPAVAPAQPAAPSASAGDQSVVVWWSPPPDDGGSAVTGYRVTRTPGDEVRQVGVDTSLVTFDDLTNGTDYTFTVAALNAIGLSPASAASPVATPFGSPGTPGAPEGTSGDGQVGLVWTPAAENGRPIAYYEIVGTPGDIEKLVEGGNTTTIIDGLDNGTAYSFTVRAYSDLVTVGGAGAASEPSATFTPLPAATAPSQPDAPTVFAGDGLAHLAWDAPADGGRAIDHFTVAAFPGGATIDVVAPATDVVFDGLENEGRYRFTISATNAVGTSETSTPSDWVTPTAAIIIPEPPGTPYALAGDGSVVVWWAPSVDEVSHYEITAWSGEAGSRTELVTKAVVGNDAVFADLTHDGDLAFTVRGVNSAGSSLSSSESNVVRPAVGSGYWMLELDGHVFSFGDAITYGDVVDEMVVPVLNAIALEALPTGDGYWILDSGGRVWPLGTAAHHGDVDLSVLDPGEVPAAISTMPTGDGYWVFTDRGRALPFGSAKHFGDAAELDLVGVIINSVATSSGNGYYMVGSDGGVFAFGDAQFHGSVPQVLPGVVLDGPVVGIVSTQAAGYWLVASDGGVFAFGDAQFVGSVPGVLEPGAKLAQPVNGMVSFADGYLMVASDGGVFNFSSRPFIGSLGADPPPHPIVGLTPQEPVPSPERLVGSWTGIDANDNSTQTIEIDATGWVERGGVTLWTYRVRWHDDEVAACQVFGGAYPATSDSAATSLGNSLPVAVSFSCHTATVDEPLGDFEVALGYDPETDTLSDGTSTFTRP